VEAQAMMYNTMYDIMGAVVIVAPVWLVAIGAALYLWEAW
jgi:hypothetical protein